MNNILEEDLNAIIAENLAWEKLKNKSVMLTGAGGMIGSYLLYVLLVLNDKMHYNIKVNAVVRAENKLPNEIRNRSDVNVIIADVTEKLPETGKIDYVIHAASPASPLNPRSCYSEGKKAAETMCVSFREEYGLNVKIARLAHTYGPGMSIYDGRVQADFLKNIYHREDIVLKSEGNAIRTYTYIADAVAGLYRILLNSDDVVYNIGNENAKVSIRELAEILVGLYPEKGLKLIFDIPEGGTKGTAPYTLGILDSSKIRRLGWNPQYSIKEGFKRTLEYLEQEHVEKI